jgi:hypothetical protein
MGIYADIRGTQVKASGLVAKVVCKATGTECADEAPLDRDGAIRALNILDAMFSDGLSLSRVDMDGVRIAAADCWDIAAVAEFAARLVDWLVNDQTGEPIRFG